MESVKMGKKKTVVFEPSLQRATIRMIRMPEQASCKLLENLLDGDREGSEAISDAEGTLRDRQGRAFSDRVEAGEAQSRGGDKCIQLGNDIQMYR